MKFNDKPTVTSMIIGGKRRLAYVYPDGREVIQEYDQKTHQILSRKAKKPTTFKQSKWEYDIGQFEEKGNAQILKSNNTPIFLRKDSIEAFQWRIRNLPYPQDTYILQIDQQKQEIVLKTTNKKYYKRFDVTDLKRANIKLSKQNVSLVYKNNTLVISYKKPQNILQKQFALRKQFQKMNVKKPKEGDIECTTQ